MSLGFLDCAHHFWALMIISSAILLAFFQISIHKATVGMEVVTSKILALGVYPIRASNGVCYVVSLGHELCVNSARGR